MRRALIIVLTRSRWQCVDSSANYYTVLCFVTVTPVVLIIAGRLALGARNMYKGIKNAQNLEFWAYVLLFLELVLSGVSTIGACAARPLTERFVTASRATTLQCARRSSASILMVKARS